jgi:hypothetical protein
MEKLIAAFERSSTSVIQAKLQDYRGRAYLDIRVWTREGAELKPTYKGLTLDVSLLGELRKAIDSALAEIEIKVEGGGEGEGL